MTVIRYIIPLYYTKRSIKDLEVLQLAAALITGYCPFKLQEKILGNIWLSWRVQHRRAVARE